MYAHRGSFSASTWTLGVGDPRKNVSHRWGSGMYCTGGDMIRFSSMAGVTCFDGLSTGWAHRIEFSHQELSGSTACCALPLRMRVCSPSK
ncbi:hypothetical protein RSOLAG1IB_11103 [Rhizoctonia solani AG-1 IB]|uniref:Uncharacterized protein n=1 Tax=Thanatephorus cucumeris (strain AG1-IB / isolate 7/3/14) TaxID=1108050 RepID=A0A0B7F776_THACB|nr:hypothetical protein RSOLAG1IB_11103 [Rhizoctonia solani AG-1 IB]